MRAALITGGSSGIGLATARRFAQLGYGVAIAARDGDRLAAAAAQLREAGTTDVLAVMADVSREQDVARIVREAYGRWGRIDVLVNNAGVAPCVPLVGLSTEAWREILDTNLTSAFLATRAVWPIMEGQFRAATQAGAGGAGGGVIVNISSMASRDPFPGLGAYGCAKVALNMLTLVTAREGAAVGIRAVGIAPAAVDTPMFRGLVAGLGMGMPGEILQPSDVAAAVAEAAEGSLRYSSGETIFLHSRPA